VAPIIIDLFLPDHTPFPTSTIKAGLVASNKNLSNITLFSTSTIKAGPVASVFINLFLSNHTPFPTSTITAGLVASRIKHCLATLTAVLYRSSRFYTAVYEMQLGEGAKCHSDWTEYHEHRHNLSTIQRMINIMATQSLRVITYGIRILHLTQTWN